HGPSCSSFVHASASTETYPLSLHDALPIFQTVTGGGFGGKEEYPSMIGGHAALLAWKSGRPVKIMYDRLEDIAATTKRHPSVSRSEEHTSELPSLTNLVCRLLLEEKNK